MNQQLFELYSFGKLTSALETRFRFEKPIENLFRSLATDSPKIRSTGSNSLWKNACLPQSLVERQPWREIRGL
jgi:hypothetical protein